LLLKSPTGAVIVHIDMGAFVEVAEDQIVAGLAKWKATGQLHEACRSHDITLVKRLLDEGADIDRRSHQNDGERVPLEVAIGARGKHKCKERYRGHSFKACSHNWQ
jgi:hypothetical protein